MNHLTEETTITAPRLVIWLAVVVVVLSTLNTIAMVIDAIF